MATRDCPPVPRLWQLTRNRYARRLYERLAEAGFTFVTLDAYVHEHPKNAVVPKSGAPTIEIYDHNDPAISSFAFDGLAGDDRAVIAYLDGTIAGSLIVSGGQEVFVPALDASISFDGAYIWDVFVDPEFRQRGVATSLIRHGLATTATVFDAETAIALIAPDNTPSKRAFASNGFKPRENHSYLQIRGFERRFRRGHIG